MKTLALREVQRRHVLRLSSMAQWGLYSHLIKNREDRKFSLGVVGTT